jgi:hypothetical protein
MPITDTSPRHLTAIPPDATPFPSTASTPFPRAQEIVIEGIKAQIAHQNEETTKRYTSAVADWKINARRSQELGLKAPDKPHLTYLTVLNQFKDDEGTVWLWERSDEPAGEVPQDLPPVTPKPSGVVVSIGINLGGAWYQSLQQDNAPDGYLVTKDGGTYQKVRSPFGGWWLKVK